MAEQLAEWPTFTRTRKSRYPWEQWTDGSIWKVMKGEDFESEPKTFVQGLYAHAKRHGGKVKVGTTGEDTVVFVFSTNGTNGHVPADSSVDVAAPTE